MNLEFYKENYLNEFDVKNELHRSLQLPMAIIVVIGGVLSVFIQGLNDAPWKVNTILLILFLTLAIVSLVNLHYLSDSCLL